MPLEGLRTASLVHVIAARTDLSSVNGLVAPQGSDSGPNGGRFRAYHRFEKVGCKARRRDDGDIQSHGLERDVGKSRRVPLAGIVHKNVKATDKVGGSIGWNNDPSPILPQFGQVFAAADLPLKYPPTGIRVPA